MARRRTYRNRSALEANQESRNGKVLKVFRRVDQEQASRIGGILQELSRSEDIPRLKTVSHISAYILDPRILKPNIVKGMVTGVKIARIADKIDEADEFIDGTIKAELGTPYLVSPKKRTILVPLISEELDEEVEKLNRLMAEENVPGFSHKGTIKGHRKITPAISIGNFDVPVANEIESRTLDAIDTGLEMLALNGLGRAVTLGQMQVRSYKL